MGRPPKPTKLKMLEGNRGRRELKPEPEPTGKIRRPRHLSEGARQVWTEYAQVLTGCGLLTAADCDTFSALCETMAKLRSGEHEPGTSEWFKLADHLRKVANDFGMTPRGRVGLVVGSKERGEDPMEALLG